MRRPALVFALGISVCLLTLGASASPPAPTPSPTPDPTPPPIITVGRMGAAVPAPGESVVMYGDFLDGTSEKLVVQTLEDGTVLVNPPEGDEPIVGRARRATGECADTFQSGVPNVWAGTMNWLFKSSSTPTYLTVSATVTSLRDGTKSITQEINNCGRPDTVSAAASYQGSTSLSANLNASNQCTTRDSTSVVDFGPLTGWVAGTCNWLSGSTRVESDLRLNNNGLFWTNGSCSGSPTAFYVEGLTAHERGHTWNANDFPSGHPNLTMGGANGQCPGPDAKRTIGLGDMLTLEARY